MKNVLIKFLYLLGDWAIARADAIIQKKISKITKSDVFNKIDRL